VRKNNKKMISFFLLLLGSSPWLFIIVSFVKEQHIQHEMEERLEKELLQTIVVAEDDIHWVKKGKEIWVNGKMFDIKSTESKNGIFFFSGLYDEEETHLKKKMEEGWKKNSPVNNSLARFLASLQNVFFENDNCIFPPVHINNTFSSWIPANLASQYKVILTPPPQG
jgi:hypothetical protein